MKSELEKKLFQEKIINLPNFISFLRLVFLPFFILDSKEYYFSNYSLKYYSYSMSSLSFIYLSDYLDGLIARKTHTETVFGKYLDPVCDKIVGILTFLVMVRFFQMPIWILIYVIIREIFGSYIGYYLFYKRGEQGTPNVYGKWSIAIAGFMNYYYLSLPLFLQNKEIWFDLPCFVYVGVNLKSNWEYAKEYTRRGT